jgi:hypothetical protein
MDLPIMPYAYLPLLNNERTLKIHYFIYIYKPFSIKSEATLEKDLYY